MAWIRSGSILKEKDKGEVNKKKNINKKRKQVTISERKQVIWE